MNEFILKNANCNIEDELSDIGFDKSYLNKAVDKFKYKNIKIFGLTIPQANILKQTAISVGADCAVHRETITSKVDKTDCLLGGSYSQLKKIVQKLKTQPFSLSKLANVIEENLNGKLEPLVLKNKTFDFTKPYIVGVLNITPDSFSDGGEFFKLDNAKKRLLEMIEEGADIIDIGAETTKPYSEPTGDDEQLKRLLPVLNFIKEQNIKIPISIDTRSACVALKCIEAGADIVNDVSGLEYDVNMVKVVAETGVSIVIQHSKGTPENMQLNTSYENLMDEIFFSLKKKIEFAISNGINREKIIIDPGIGFGKTKENNITIINRIDELYSLKRPVMLGISRKGFLGLKDSSNEIKDAYTLALNSLAASKQVNFIRVHNVKLHNDYFSSDFLK